MTMLARRSLTSLYRQTRKPALMFRAMSSETTDMEYTYESLKVTRPRVDVLQVELNRPAKRNAMNTAFWREMVECFNKISQDSGCRAVVLSGAGKMFTAGIDLMSLAEIAQGASDEIGRKALQIRRILTTFQESFTVIEKCPKPVIAAIHNACIGGGVDMITACDIRYASSDAWFQVKEVDIGMAADVGTLQRLPKVIGNDSLVRELCYTGRKMHVDEAKECGLVSRVFPDKDTLLEGALDLAAQIATKSPIAIQGIKKSLVYARDHSVADGLEQIATWNQSMLQAEDLMKAASATMSKETPTFSKL